MRNIRRLLSRGYEAALCIVPVLSHSRKSPTDQRVLGTFGTYYRAERQPTPREIEAVTALAGAAGRVLDVGPH